MPTDNIQLIRLVTGEEIVGDVSKLPKDVYSEDGKYALIVKKPILLVCPAPGQIAFAPWMGYADHEEAGIKIKEDSIMFVLKLKPKIIEEYKKIWSKLALPDSNKEILIPPAGLKLK